MSSWSVATRCWGLHGQDACCSHTAKGLLEVPHWTVAQPPSISTQPPARPPAAQRDGVSTLTTHITKAKKKNAGGGPGLGPHHLSSPVTVGGPLHPFLQIMLQACL